MTPAEHFIFYRQLHRAADQDNLKSNLCYFIGGDKGPIKIGYSHCPKTRLEALQLGSPTKLKLLATAPGGVARERAYHSQFQAWRLHGEWFSRCHPLLKEIRRLNSGKIEWPRPIIFHRELQLRY